MTSWVQQRGQRQQQQTLLGWGVIGLLSAAILGLQGLTIQETRSGFTDEYVVRKEQNFAIASALEGIGLSNLAASWLWMEFVQYYGDSPRRRQQGYGLTYDYLDKITQLDEEFYWAYRYISSAVGFSAGQPQRAEQLIQRGLEHLDPQKQPDGYRLYLDLAINYFILIGDAEAGRGAYYAAAEWYEQAGLEGNAPELWRALGDRLVESPNSKQVRFTVWNQVLNLSDDPVTRERALIELGALGARFRRQPEGQIEVIPPDWDETSAEVGSPD